MRMDRRAGLLSVKKTLNAMTWAEIKTISAAGQATNYWAIGDRKNVTLNGSVNGVNFSNYSTYAFIIGFNHNSTYEGNKRTHFQLAKTALTGGLDICFVSSNYNTATQTTGFVMNTTRTNNGGWASSYMRNNICGTSKTSYSGTLIGAFPSDLRTALQSVTKYTDNVGGGSTEEASVTATTDYVFLLADYEVFGVATQVNPYEADKQAQYAYYAAGNSKIKYKHTDTTVAAIYFSRSPYCQGTNSLAFKSVQANGNTGGNAYANTPKGIAPCFCV